MYLPDLIDSEGHVRSSLNREYLFNVINTIRPRFFPENISTLMRCRKDLHADKTKSYINIETNIYNLISNSALISKSKLSFPVQYYL